MIYLLTMDTMVIFHSYGALPEGNSRNYEVNQLMLGPGDVNGCEIGNDKWT